MDIENDLIELEIESLAFEGESVAKKDSYVYFVKGGIPGDVVLCKISKKRRRHAEAIIEKIVKPSPSRILPKCSHFGECGGCSLQNLTYEDQLFWKRNFILDSFQRLGGFTNPDISETIGSPKSFNYRNKMEFSFGDSRWLTKEEVENIEIVYNKNFALGLHVPGRFDKVLDVKNCDISPEIFNKILTEVKIKSESLNLVPYNSINKTGYLKNLICRWSELEQKALFILLTTQPVTDEELTIIDWFLTLNETYPEAGTLIHAVNNSLSPVAIGDIKKITGKDHLMERILGIDYKISPFSFFQTNSSQLEKFISEILLASEIKETDIVWDLYCGTGSITLPAAKYAKEIYGIELVESSIQDAKYNAEINSIKNVQFFSDDLHNKLAPELLNKLPKPDIVILDPPRAGMHTNLINHLMNIAPQKIIYVSCNPATQARDCDHFAKKYDLISIQPVDMFPQTYHIESIAHLELKDEY
jgi:23S rRNA (uracil1939-C5)-methyltransferase